MPAAARTRWVGGMEHLVAAHVEHLTARWRPCQAIGHNVIRQELGRSAVGTGEIDLHPNSLTTGFQRSVHETPIRPVVAHQGGTVIVREAPDEFAFEIVLEELKAVGRLHDAGKKQPFAIAWLRCMISHASC